MPQLDLLTFFDQFLVVYFFFIVLHFFTTVGPVSFIFEVLYARHLLFIELCTAVLFFIFVLPKRQARLLEQYSNIRKLANSFAVQ